MYHEKREKAGEKRRAYSEIIMQQVHELIKTVLTGPVGPKCE